MTHKTVRAALLFAALVALAGCPKKDDNKGPAYTIDNLCQQLDGSFKKWHALEYGSCGAPLQDGDVDHLSPLIFMGDSVIPNLAFAQYTGDYELVAAKAVKITCQGDLKDDYQNVKASVNAGRVKFDANNVDTCIKAGQDAKAQGKSALSMPDACTKIFTGLVGENGDCAFNFDCATGLYCKATDASGSCNGKCVKPLAIGSACASADVCADGSACQNTGTGTPYTCTALPTDGQACPSGDCAPGFYCQSDASTGDYTTCAAKKAQDAACTDYSECADGLDCRESKCQPPLPASKLGEPCGGAENRACVANSCLYCEGGDATNPGVCKAFPKPTAACGTAFTTDDQGNPQTYKVCDQYGLMYCDDATTTCLPAARQGEACFTTETDTTALGGALMGNCMYADNFCWRSGPNVKTGVCKAYPAIGEACDNKYDTAPVCPTGSYCKGLTSSTPGVCTALEADGTACTSDAYCASGLCADDGSGNGTCAEAPALGSPCAKDVDYGDSYCAKDAYCDSTTNCAALKANGADCTSASECGTGYCDSKIGKCVIECQSAGMGVSCWSGLDWFSRYVFASGALVFLATRRRKAKKA